MEEPIPEDRNDHAPDTDSGEGPAAPPEDKTPGDAEEQAPAPSGHMPEVVVSHHNGGGRGRRGLKIVAWAVILVLVAGLCWFAYKYTQKKPAAPATAKSKDISLLKIAMNRADYGKIYPDMSLSEFSYLVNDQMFEGLVRYEDKSKIVPELASDWTNPDRNTWVFTIKSGIKFHDGHTLTAKDVKYSLDSIKTGGSDLAQTFDDTIVSVEVTGSNKVKITTTRPDPVLLNKLASLFIIDADLPKGDEPSQAGTGPYRIKPGTTPTSNHIQMVAFNAYHGGKPQTHALDFSTADGTKALTKGLKDGKYNIIGPVSPSIAKEANASEFVASEANVEYVGLNTVKAGPLQKKQVRQALRYALDPLAIAMAADNTEPTALSQLIPQSIPGYNPAIKSYGQDVAKAKQLLKQAGYPDGITLTLSTANGKKQTDEITNELKKAGITLKVDQYTDFDKFINHFVNGNAETYIVDYSSDTLDGLDIYNSTIPPFYYSNPKLADLLDQAGTETDPAKRLKILQEVAVIVDQDVPVVPLYSENDIWLMDQNYVLHQDLPSAYISVYFSKVHRQ